VSPELLEFLNRSQEITDAFFPGNSASPKLEYSLRPVSSQTSKLIFVIDGVTMNATESALQMSFSWPGPDASRGAEGKVLAGGQEFGFARYPGLWGAFHLFRAADQRTLKAPEVTWSQISGIGALPQPLRPPVKVQILSFPGGIDVLNPAFFRTLTCPSKAVVTE
jgi:type VI protein secretion system component VasK